MSEEVIFTWRRAGVMCRPYMPRRGLGPVTPGVMHRTISCLAVLLLARPPSQSDCGLLVVIIDLLLQLELHTSPPAHMFMTNYIVPADHTVSING